MRLTRREINVFNECEESERTEYTILTGHNGPVVVVDPDVAEHLHGVLHLLDHRRRRKLRLRKSIRGRSHGRRGQKSNGLRTDAVAVQERGGGSKKRKGMLRRQH
ncbi:uncharacterized protein G2W53_018618 [Senna tora]|uniref:Uncharacterized protein n=1 Tax=Senna tora TaxID=362788 RepID=A0A834TTF5_9FABA|nr:uncharacterized protein G2W53_018618 [Senna tora]